MYFSKLRVLTSVCSNVHPVVIAIAKTVQRDKTLTNLTVKQNAENIKPIHTVSHCQNYQS